MVPVTNAHTHLELTCLAQSFSSNHVGLLPWLGDIARRMKQLTGDEIHTSVQQGIDALKACGTTHVCDVTALWSSVQPLQDSGLGGIVFLEVLGFNKTQGLEKLERAVTRIDQARQQNITSPMKVGLTVHSPYTCHPALLEEAAARCRAEGIPLSIHAAETRLEDTLIRRARIISFIGNNLVSRKIAGVLSRFPLKQGSVFYLDSLGVLDVRPFLVHCIHLTDKEIDRVAGAGCAVVHCPRSNDRLGCGRMPLERFISAGVDVYLGTDSLASSPSLDIHEEAEFAKNLHHGLVPDDVIDSMIHHPLP
ncbi:MAG: amidohydrolase family protein [Deltaproteobacteria bacterium]|nr:amidohydrolase family protein [Deltaproteobacteria bacterium]MBW2170664.1 amidohydrolase family protein [Deltaproteobacteria bacterium]